MQAPPTFTRPEAAVLYAVICQKCTELGFQNKVNPKALDLVVERFLGKVQMRVELQHMLVWMLDRGHTVLRTMRLMNWLEKAYQIQKREQRRLLDLQQQRLNEDPAIAKQRLARATLNA